MTGLAQTSPEPYLGDRTPHLSVAVLLGAVLIIGVLLRVLNAEPAAAQPPLSGAPVEGALDASDPVAQAQPTAAIGSATESLTAVLPAGQEADPVPLGPAAFPPDAIVRLVLTLPTAEQGFITVSHAMLGAEGALTAAEPLQVMVTPGDDGRATVETSVEALSQELGAGIYRVQVLWQEEVIGQEDVALGLHQPAGAAIFEEPRQVVFTAGEYTGAQFDPRGGVAEEKTFELGADSGAPAAAYARFNGVPHVLVTRGVWAGYWVPLGGGAALR